MLFELVQIGSRIVEKPFSVTFVVAELKKMNKEEFIGSLKAKVEEKMGRTLVTLMDFNRLSITNTTRWGIHQCVNSETCVELCVVVLSSEFEYADIFGRRC